MFLGAFYSPLLFGATTSGEITSSETWSGTVFLSGDVTVTPTGNLTILPGTRIECDPRADDRFGGTNQSRIELIIDNGTLNAIGTEANPILFTAGVLGTNPPARGDWYGIRISSSSATLRYCIIEFGKEGLRVEGGTPVVEYCDFRKNEWNGVGVVTSATLSDCIARENSTGIGAYQYRPTTIVLSRCALQNNGTGLSCGTTNFILGCTIQSNSALGMVAQNTANLGAQVTALVISVSNSTVSANLGPGLQVWNYAFENAYPVLVDVSQSLINSNNGAAIVSVQGDITLKAKDCQITDNLGTIPGYAGQFGLLCGSIALENCTVSRNGGIGVRAASVAAKGSVVANNTLAGISADAIGTAGIVGNIISGNQVGLELLSTVGPVHGLTNNDFYANTDYDLRNSKSAAVIADGNYWGEPTTTELHNAARNLTKIFDSRDDATVGQVLIRTWSDTPLVQGMAPCIVSQPKSRRTTLGTEVTFQVLAMGTAPLGYRWQKDGTLIDGATRTTLTLSNISTNHAGIYSAVVTNSLGQATSGPALLEVDPTIAASELAVAMYAGVTINGTKGKTYSIQCVDDLSGAWFDWVALTNLTLPTSPFLFFDTSSPYSPTRFYRTVQLP